MATSKIQSHGWELIYEGTYQTSGSVDFSQYNEIWVSTSAPGAGATLPFFIPVRDLGSSTKIFYNQGSPAQFGAVTSSITVSLTYLKVSSTVNGNDTSSTTPFKIYGKK